MLNIKSVDRTQAHYWSYFNSLEGMETLWGYLSVHTEEFDLLIHSCDRMNKIK
jgi:hypothetical protein